MKVLIVVKNNYSGYFGPFNFFCNDYIDEVERNTF